uniref:Epiphycan n=1 Tax=Eptatretus burgeri TaxID=7764 RepID=A0A8C4WUT6_EPTBU
MRVTPSTCELVALVSVLGMAWTLPMDPYLLSGEEELPPGTDGDQDRYLWEEEHIFQQPQLPVEGSADHEDGGQADEKPDLLGREAKPHDLPTCLLCICLHGSVYCDDHKLKTIPPLPKDTAYFYARHNNIRTIRKADFAGYDQLKRIDVSNNAIEEVEEDTFTQLPALSDVLLADNSLTVLPGLPNTVTHLDLRKNHLTSDGIEAEAFKDMENLNFLYLSDNNLDFVPVPLPDSLKVLHLQNNNIQHLQDDTFCNPKDLHYFRKGLEDIRLDGNPINLSNSADAYTCLPRIPTGRF